jgi:hypothetical protein
MFFLTGSELQKQDLLYIKNGTDYFSLQRLLIDTVHVPVPVHNIIIFLSSWFG